MRILNHSSYDIAEIMREMELDLIKSLHRNLGRHIAAEAVEGFNWAQWQAVKLKEFRHYKKQNKAIIAKYVNRIDKETEKAILAQYKEAGDATQKEFLRAVRLGFAPREQSGNDSFFGINDRKLNALIKSTKDDFLKQSQAVYRQMDDVYRQVVFKVQIHAGAGVKTVEQAVDIATHDFRSSGIATVVYKNGRRIGADSYSEMAIRTAQTRARLVGDGAMRKEWGESLVQVSRYGSCSPTCFPWQGKVYIDDVYSGGKRGDYGGKYPLLSVAIKAGLFHPNCRHSQSTFFEDINEANEPMNADETVANYKLEQKQRYNERTIRKYKRLEAGALDETNSRKCNRKVKEWQSKQKTHIAENPQLRRDYSRENTRG